MTKSWDNPTFDRLKQEIKDELTSVESASGVEGRLQHIHDHISKLQSDLSGPAQMRRFIFAVSALMHHMRHGGLKSSQVNQLVELCEAILKLQRIEFATSRMSHLYGEVFSGVSQISWSAGFPVRSMFEQQLAKASSGRNQLGSEAYRVFSMGMRFLGLGFMDLAISHFAAAEEKSQDNPDSNDRSLIERARLGRLKCLRLMGCFDRAQILHESSREIWCSTTGKKSPEQLEFLWETCCLALQRDQKYQPMVSAVNKGEHQTGVYILEAHLWAKSISDTSMSRKLRKLDYLAKKKIIDPKGLGFAYRLGQAFDACYDTELLMAKRMQILAKVMIQIHRIASIDKELLAWAAATRFFARNKYLPLACLSLKQYESLCLRLSDGESKDLLNLHDGLNSAAWASGASIFS
jgi:hypothetical protein